MRWADSVLNNSTDGYVCRLLVYSSSTFELQAESRSVHNTISNVIIHPYSSVILTATGERVFTDVSDDESDVIALEPCLTQPVVLPGIQLWEVGHKELTVEAGDVSGIADVNASDQAVEMNSTE